MRPTGLLLRNSTIGRTCIAVGLALALGAGCAESEESSDDSTEQRKKKNKRKKKREKKTAAASAAVASAKPKKAPSAADLSKMTWTVGDKSQALETINMKKRCFLKNLQVVLPEKASIQPLMGQRGCLIRPWGKDGAYFALLSDEIKTTYVSMEATKKASKSLERYIVETEDSYLAKSKKKDPHYFGSVERKVGKHTIHCLVKVPSADHDLEVARGMLELCTTMTTTDKTPTPPTP